jgi:hypothetical protein
VVEPSRSHLHPQFEEAAPLFLYKVGRVVLVGYMQGNSWVLARGWRSRDRFSDVRLWRFSDADAFAKQVFRLSQEEDVDLIAARDAAREASHWAAALGAS